MLHVATSVFLRGPLPPLICSPQGSRLHMGPAPRPGVGNASLGLSVLDLAVALARRAMGTLPGLSWSAMHAEAQFSKAMMVVVPVLLGDGGEMMGSQGSCSGGEVLEALRAQVDGLLHECEEADAGVVKLRSVNRRLAGAANYSGVCTRGTAFPSGNALLPVFWRSERIACCAFWWQYFASLERI